MIILTLLHPVKQIPIQVWTFPNEAVIRIGRSTDNQVVLYSAVVSRHHVELRRIGTHWEVINLGTNGTFLDGRRITQEPITDGAVIRLARSGPNIQIRMGEEALKEMSEGANVLRSIPPRTDLPLIQTEITRQNPEDDVESNLEGNIESNIEGDIKGDSKGDSNTDNTMALFNTPSQMH